jgi:sugar lactone lactonase YvrE
LIADEASSSIWRFQNDQGTKLLGDDRLLSPQGVAVASDSIIVADTGHHRILRIDTQGQTTTIAGSGEAGFADGGIPQFNSPTRLAVAEDGNIYVCDTGNHRIRKIATDGTVTTVAGNGTAGISGDGEAATSAQLNAPKGIALYGNKIYIADTGNERIRVVDLATGRIFSVDTLAQPTPEASASYQFSQLQDIAVCQGYLYALAASQLYCCHLP